MFALISLLSFLLPTQLGFHFDTLSTTVYGFKIDYLIPTLYLTDIIAFLIIVLGLIKVKLHKKQLVYLVIYLIFIVINTYNSSAIIPTFYKWLKVSEMFLLGFVLINTKKFDTFKHFIKPLSYSMLGVCLLGLWQFLTKGSVGGLFYWFGERTFLFNDPNIAPYPYSTFSHPNSFAGFLLVFILFLFVFKNKFNPRYFWSLLTLVATNLVLTNSLNVYFAIVLLLILEYVKNKNIFSFLYIDFSARFVTHRLELIKASLQLIKEHFWFGVGLNNFIPHLPRVTNTFVNSWELQPVHNIYLLVFSELGIIGFLFFATLIFSSLVTLNYPLLAVLITGLSDHYWLTLQQNILLFTYVLVVSRKLKIKSTV